MHSLPIPLTIRPYQDEDQEQVIQLWRQCHLVMPWHDPRQDIRRKVQMQPELFLVGAVDQRVVATVMAGYDGHRGWLYAVAVAPERQRQGWGRRMVEEAETRLKALGCNKINLQVRASNAQVIDFYKRLGFAVEELVSMGKRL